jgi:hypothetical protein
MGVKNNFFVEKCPKCDSPIRIYEAKNIGGINDKGGVIIECNECKTPISVLLSNPKDISITVKGGVIIDSWIDIFPSSFETLYNIKESQTIPVRNMAVFGYEKPPKTKWVHSPTPLFCRGTLNHEKEAENALKTNLKKINENYRTYYDRYVKGKDTADSSFVIINYELLGIKYKAVFAKQIDNEYDLSHENLYLISHSAINLEEEIDGIYTRNESLIYLERLLNRWRYSANEVLLIVPFIGFHYKNSEEARIQLWDWLGANVDANKTNLITRKGTFNLFKQAQDNTGIPFKLLVEYGLIEPLIEIMNDGGTKFFQKSHAKYYVGVYDDYVEVISGSFNIHQGGYFENLTFKKYDKDFFLNRYLKKLLPTFNYSNKIDNKLVHYMVVGDSEQKNNCKGLYEFITTDLFQ